MAKKQSKKWNEVAVEDETIVEETIVEETAIAEDPGDDPTERPIISRLPVAPKVEEVEAKDKVVDTMDCLQHAGFSINVMADRGNPNRRYAICTCGVRSNHWQGKVVWEHTDEK